jgi:hypothetical protein
MRALCLGRASIMALRALEPFWHCRGMIFLPVLGSLEPRNWNSPHARAFGKGEAIADYLSLREAVRIVLPRTYLLSIVCVMVVVSIVVAAISSSGSRASRVVVTEA